VNSRIGKQLLTLMTSVLAVLLAMCVGTIVILINGDNPLLAYKSLFQGSFSNAHYIASTLSTATPLIFTGLGVAVAFKAGVANIGAEGQLYMGAIAAAVVGIYLHLPAVLLIPAALLASFIAGGLYGMIPAVLKVRCNTNEVVTTLMLNYIAQLFTSYLVNYPLKAAGSAMGMTVNVQDAAKLPILFSGTRLNIGFLIAVAAAVLVAVMFKHTSMGYEMRLSGENPIFARYSGIDTDRRMVQGMFLGGGLSGLGGAILVLGIQYKFVQNISPGYGFDGLTIALVAVFNAYAVLPVSVLFGALRAGGVNMELNTNVPSELSQVIQATIILFMAAQAFFSGYLSESVNIAKRALSLKKKGGGSIGRNSSSV
jgi:general nucleoside transport system permease protein